MCSVVSEFAAVSLKDSTNFPMRSHFSGGNVASNPHKAPLTKIFDKYREDPQNEPDEIDLDGTMKMCQDMQISIEDVGFLIFSELAQSPSMGKLTREGFVDGLAEAG